MRIHNLYTDAHGESHFRDIEIEWVEERRGSRLSKRLPAADGLLPGDRLGAGGALDGSPLASAARTEPAMPARITLDRDTTAAAGAAQDSLDALRTATSTSYYKGADSLWLKVVSTGSTGGGRGGRGGGTALQVSK